MSGSVIVAGARTPIGRLLGALSGLSAVELGGVAIKAALERAGVAPADVQYVIMGQVLQAGAGQLPSRQAAVEVASRCRCPSLTVNKVCLSGLDAIALADQLIRAGSLTSSSPAAWNRCPTRRISCRVCARASNTVRRRSSTRWRSTG